VIQGSSGVVKSEWNQSESDERWAAGDSNAVAGSHLKEGHIEYEDGTELTLDIGPSGGCGHNCSVYLGFPSTE
jgi:hypothetical protein